MTHIDLLTPAMEWAPPYNWQQPTRPKEKQIREALEVVREVFGDRIAGAAPVCTADGKVYGIGEDLLPAMAGRLDEARAVGLLRVLHAEADAGKLRKVFEQLKATGLEAWRALWVGH
jgi:hypothetical protein